MLHLDFYDDSSLKETIKNLNQQTNDDKAKLKEQEDKRTKVSNLVADRLEFENRLSEQKKRLADTANKLDEIKNKINDLKLRKEGANVVVTEEEFNRLKTLDKTLESYKAMTGINWDCSDRTSSGIIVNSITQKVTSFQIDRNNKSSANFSSLIAKSCA